MAAVKVAMTAVKVAMTKGGSRWRTWRHYDSAWS